MSAANGLSIANRRDFLLVEFSGPFSEQTGKRCVDEMVAACGRTGLESVLLDCRGLTGTLPMMERFRVTEYAAVHRATLLQVALLVRPDMILPDRFIENVAVNRGLKMKVFADPAEAQQWLIAADS